MKKSGFTLIEVIIAMMLLGILMIPILSLHQRVFQLTGNTLIKDEAYNITHSICEKFMGETGAVENKIVVIYINEFDEISKGTEITTLLANDISMDTFDYSSIKNNNFNNKKYAIILAGKQNGNLNVLRVTTMAMDGNGATSTLRTARAA